MPDMPQVLFSHKELVEILIKERGIHEGIWGLATKFGFSAANIGTTPAEINPAAILPVLGIGLQRMDKESNIAVDAAKVNPQKRNRKTRKGK